MTNRLRDEVDSAVDGTAAVQDAARLVRAASSLTLDPSLKARVRARLNERETVRSAWRLRPIVVGVVLVGMIAIAGAAAVRVWQQRAAVETPAEAPAVPALHVPATAPRIARPAAPAPSPEPEMIEPELTAGPEPVAPAKPPAKPVAVADDGKRPPPETVEAVLVLDATHALHYEHDPRRALALLESYLGRYPRGPLVEESLALAIEAASALGDPAAATFAQTYLERFPAGRFSEAARRAVSRFAK